MRCRRTKGFEDEQAWPQVLDGLGEVAPLLAYLRELQRRLAVAVVLVHHARKGASKARAGQALRGSSEFHAWGDSNLYCAALATTSSSLSSIAPHSPSAASTSPSETTAPRSPCGSSTLPPRPPCRWPHPHREDRADADRNHHAALAGCTPQRLPRPNTERLPGPRDPHRRRPRPQDGGRLPPRLPLAAGPFPLPLPADPYSVREWESGIPSFPCPPPPSESENRAHWTTQFARRSWWGSTAATGLDSDQVQRTSP